MSSKLNQINALVTGRKTEVEKIVGDIYKLLQKPELFNGLNRTYRPKKEDGDQRPPETKKISYSVKDLIDQVVKKWSDLWNLTATQDAANQIAKADIVVNGVVILKQVPVTTLLFLEKQVTNLESFISKLPLLDAAEAWKFDDNTAAYRSSPTETVSSKKVPRNHVKYEATKEHPAQVEVFQEDIPVGTWAQTLFSAAIPATERQKYLERVKELRDAVKLSREHANMTAAEKVHIGESIFNFVFGK